MNKNLELIETFFKYDLEIKKILHDCAPTEIDGYNQEYIIKYSDKLYRALVDIEFYIKRIFIKCGYGKNELNELTKLFKIYNQLLTNCKSDFNKLKSFYTDFFSNMNKEFIDMVASTCIGYTNNSIDLKTAKSINELLHLLHSSIVNNEKIYNSMPKLKEKINFEKYPINLYGKENTIANNIFEQFPINMSCGNVDILSLNNKILMMIRDRGHALTIEIIYNNNKCFVQYFIPKICHVGMINNLKGVTKVNDNSRYTIGMFETELESLTNELFTLINGVPMDDHMFIEGGKFYIHEEEKIK